MRRIIEAIRNPSACLAVLILFSLATSFRTTRIQSTCMTGKGTGSRLRPCKVDNQSLRETESSDEGYIQHNPALWRKQIFPSWNNLNDSLAINDIIDYATGVLDSSIGGHHLPTSIYMVDKNYTLWTHVPLREQHVKILQRMKPSERIAQSALDYLQSFENEDTHPWPALHSAIQRGGFPFLAYYKDFAGCNRRNWKRGNVKDSIPIFTLSARVDCDFAFPWPTYETIRLAKGSANDWAEVMANRSNTYLNKTAKAIWRGSLTGTTNKQLNESTRWNLCELSARNPDLLDAQLVKIPEWRTDANAAWLNSLAPRIPMEDFQEYAAVVDVDGNSWSSRFARLLCMDSVVLKIQPTYVDHFFYDELVPWEHYVPISSTMDDMIPKIEWVLTHTEKARSIVKNAHNWCANHMIKVSLFEDILSAWNSYVLLLNAAESSNWSQAWMEQATNLTMFTVEMARTRELL